MLVKKFGGTSVESPVRMREVLSIIKDESHPQIVVLSAMAGTTNALVEIAQMKDKGKDASILIATLEQRYREVLQELFSDAFLERGKKIMDNEFAKLRSSNESGEILAQGEMLSTQLFALFCESEGYNVLLLNALEFMRIDDRGEPDLQASQSLLNKHLSKDKNTDTFITQGYICKGPWGEVTNLGRGGSDYTATILGAILSAQEVQIWTDIDGLHNNDPRIVNDTTPVRHLSYREAAELAYFGAKILHPTCVLPAEQEQVPVRLKYTMEPQAQGTLISHEPSGKKIAAIAAKDGITAIKIYSRRMLMAYGFLRKVFQVFEDYQTSVDMITTSEVAVSLTIDDDTNLAKIMGALSALGETAVDHDYTIICIVGSGLYDEHQDIHAIFSALHGIPVRMTSMGGSKNNISLLVKTEYKERALIALHRVLD